MIYHAQWSTYLRKQTQDLMARNASCAMAYVNFEYRVGAIDGADYVKAQASFEGGSCCFTSKIHFDCDKKKWVGETVSSSYTVDRKDQPPHHQVVVNRKCRVVEAARIESLLIGVVSGIAVTGCNNLVEVCRAHGNTPVHAAYVRAGPARDSYVKPIDIWRLSRLGAMIAALPAQRAAGVKRKPEDNEHAAASALLQLACGK